MYLGRPSTWSLEPHLTDPKYRDVWNSAVLAVIPNPGETASHHRNLINGLAPGTVNGNATRDVRPWLGSVWVGDGTGDQFDFPLGFTAVGNTTFAAICSKTTAARAANLLSTSSGTNAGARMYVNASGQLGITLGGVASYDFTAGGALTSGDPYFLAAAYNKQNGFVRFLHRNLKSGAIQSGTVTAAGTPVAGDGRYSFGGTAVGSSVCWDGAVAMGFIAHEYFEYAALLQWAKDPWGPFRFFDEARVVVARAVAGSHDATGALSADAATVTGTAAHSVLHASSGALAAAAASVAGTAAHSVLHAATGALAAEAATVAGTAAHSSAGTRTATGALAADAATVAGTATHHTLHVATGALVAGAASVSGVGAHLTLHTSTGALAAQSAIVVGAAAIGSTTTPTGGPSGTLRIPREARTLRVPREPRTLRIQ